MWRLNSDKNFHFELLRILASVRGYGADVAEILNVCEKLIPGDFESWWQNFYDLALWAKSSVQPEDQHDRISLRDAYLRASRYFFAAQFFLHGNPDDPRLTLAWEEWTKCFDKATSVMEIPAERRTLQADGFQVPIIVLRASMDSQPRPVLIIGNGLDGSMEEMLHFHGFQALERGYHVILYEGPGQCTVRRQQNIGFIPEWERVVTPVVDYAETLPFVDVKRIGLLGNSLGGFLAARAAAFEHRLAAVILIDGIFSVYEAVASVIGPQPIQHEKDGTKEAFYQSLEEQMQHSTHVRWMVNQINWTFNTSTYEVLQRAKKMTLEGIAGNIQCPTFVGDAQHDIFVEADQPQMVAEALGEKATWRKFTAEEGADAHCHVGATAFVNQVVLKWFGDQIRNINT
ncbi:hypothetical protein PV08_10497 [Exophiala spinifera]|uniref:AB hydrolase-1 domain-containing protein n=1 Tax=Exophiala spinifera TaxID=91928 RepID=A0A0D1ZDW2_9EURO|nr:uncharacterized protein PV08_10497 [Exophiala spinifera]KIW11197.1 hypothetical protein PV08_10497 [Exophiala spinifera]